MAFTGGLPPASDDEDEVQPRETCHLPVAVLLGHRRCHSLAQLRSFRREEMFSLQMVTAV